MTSDADPTDGVSATEERIAQLEDRLDRERKARRQAEMIAERGMRDLWEINRELQQRVGERSAQVGRLIAGHELARSAWSAVMAAELDRVRQAALARTATDSTFDVMTVLSGFARPRLTDEPFAARPADIAADILKRWQRPVAGRGWLLTTEADAADDEALLRWACVIALCEAVITAVVDACESGVAVVRFTVVEDRVVVTIDHPQPVDELGRGALSVAETIVRRIVEDAAGTLEWAEGSIEAVFPLAAEPADGPPTSEHNTVRRPSAT